MLQGEGLLRILGDEEKGAMRRREGREVDVVVVGGGSAGAACAYALAQHGRRVLVVEKNGFCGGTLAASLVAPMLSFHCESGEPIVFGFAQTLIDRMVHKKGSLGHLPDPLGFAPSLTPIDAEHLKIEQEKLCMEEGVEFLYHALFLRAEVRRGKEGKFVESIVLQTKSGEEKIGADYFVDATGDALLCAKAGALGRVEKKGSLQPMTTFFTMGGVDVEALVHFQKRHSEEFVLGEKAFQIVYPGTKVPYPGVCGFFSKVAAKGARYGITFRDRVLLFGGVRVGEVSVNMTRVSGNPLEARELSWGEVEGRRQVEQVATFLQKEVPGFAGAYLLQLPAAIGIRESRRVQGFYQLTERDVLQCRRFPDGVARSGYPIDLHLPHSQGLVTKKIPEGSYYEIPLRSLFPKGFCNLGVAGRCASFSHSALSSARVSAQCMAMGEGLGVALALAKDRGLLTFQIPGEEVKARVLERERPFSKEPLRV